MAQSGPGAWGSVGFVTVDPQCASDSRHFNSGCRHPRLRALRSPLSGLRRVWHVGFRCLKGLPGTLGGEGLRPHPAGPSDQKDRGEHSGTGGFTCPGVALKIELRRLIGFENKTSWLPKRDSCLRLRPAALGDSAHAPCTQ